MIICEKCGKQFKSRKAINNHKRVECGKFNKCSICGIKFYVINSRKDTAKFCSKRCKKLSQIKRIEMHCVVCGKPFMVKLSIANRPGYNCCSRKCSDIKQRGVARGGAWTKERIEKIRIAARNRKRKPIILRNMNRKELIIGIRRSVKYQEWRQDIFIRDDFTCQKCQKRGGDLEAHHKKPFNKLIKEMELSLPLFPLYIAAMIYTPLWDKENGITLCKKCHKKERR